MPVPVEIVNISTPRRLTWQRKITTSNGGFSIVMFVFRGGKGETFTAGQF